MAHFLKWINSEAVAIKFTGIKNWGNISSIPCYNCFRFFKDKSVFIPKKIHSNDNIEVFGNFCSFNCAARYINDAYSSDDQKKQKEEYLNSLKYLYYLFHTDGADHTPSMINISNIPLAPPREVMQKYGGKLTEEEYVNEIKRLSRLIK